jgi:hypothetical protein
MAKNKITVPFIFSSPEVGRTISPLKGIIWITFLILLVLIFVGIVLSIVQADESSDEIIFLLIAALSLFFIVLIVNSLLDNFFYEHITIKDNKLIFKGSKILSGGNEKIYHIGPDSKIVWSIEETKIKYMEVQYNKLIFYDIENNNNIIIKDFILCRGYKNFWSKFLNNLAKVSKLKIEKEEMRT